MPFSYTFTLMGCILILSLNNSKRVHFTSVSNGQKPHIQKMLQIRKNIHISSEMR
jgi:hypothetical protein